MSFVSSEVHIEHGEHSAKDDSIVRPILLTIFQAKNVTVQNVKMINGPEWINFVRLISLLLSPYLDEYLHHSIGE